MSIVGKIKIADLLSLDRLIPKIGVRFCLGNLVFIGLDDPEFSLSLFFFFPVFFVVYTGQSLEPSFFDCFWIT